MRYVIRGAQDYSNRFAGSWGVTIITDPDRVGEFMDNDDTRVVVVEGADDTPLTEEMNLEQWNNWKAINKPLFR